jgi:hypothetical protein
MKIFKMMHPNIPNGVIIRDMGTFHRINNGLATIGHMVCDDLPDQKVNIEKINESIGSLEMTTTIGQAKSAKLRTSLTRYSMT